MAERAAYLVSDTFWPPSDLPGRTDRQRYALGTHSNIKHICLSMCYHYTKHIPLCQEAVEKILNFFDFVILTYTKHICYNKHNDTARSEKHGNR